jgi:REP element-mobilizing transposase RayT
MFACVLAQIRFASRRFLRIVHFSVQSNHIHMLVEANDRGRLAQGMKGFAVRVARNLNGLLGIRGNVWADRYHAHALKTPREVRRALIYVLRNRVKHGGIVALDRHSSAFYFDGWHDEVGCPPPEGSPDEWPIAHSETWLINVGWRRSQGPLRLDGAVPPGRNPRGSELRRRRGAALRRQPAEGRALCSWLRGGLPRHNARRGGRGDARKHEAGAGGQSDVQL